MTTIDPCSYVMNDTNQIIDVFTCLEHSTDVQYHRQFYARLYFVSALVKALQLKSQNRRKVDWHRVRSKLNPHLACFTIKQVVMGHFLNNIRRQMRSHCCYIMQSCLTTHKVPLVLDMLASNRSDPHRELLHKGSTAQLTEE